jgi:PAS domain S-box-containing protein
MNSSEFQLRGISDPRLAVHATSALPAWLWSVDGTRILWANPVGAKVFGAANAAALAKKLFGPADAHRRQVARLAGRLPLNGTVRLERLRGFGATLGRLVTCGCARLEFADGSHGVLVAAAELSVHPMPLVERLQRLVAGIDSPIAAFARDGLLIGASESAGPLLGFRSLSEAGLDEARSDALRYGRVETQIGIGHLVLQRVGSGADAGLVALIAPGATVAAHHRHVVPAALAEPAATPVAPAVEQPMPDDQQPATSGAAPAEFALVDEFDGEPPAETIETAEPASGPFAPAAEQPLPDYEQPGNSGEAPAEFALIEEVSAQPAEPEQAAAETAAENEPPENEFSSREPSPYVEAVADEPTPPHAETPSWLDEPPPESRRHPLRFLWQMDAEGRFSLGSDEFTRLIGARTAAGFGRLWSEIAQSFALDPEGRVLKAVATRNTWSGITLNWPADGGGRLPVELSGLPVYDGSRNFAGYRGFGVCRDLDALTRLAALRRFELFSTPTPPQPLSADIVQAELAKDSAVNLPSVPDTRDFDSAESDSAELPASDADETSPHNDMDTHVETPVEIPKNVLPFRPLGEPKPGEPKSGEAKSPALTPVENSAFNELARQLSARLESEHGTAGAAAATAGGDPAAAMAPPPATQPVSEQAGWLVQPEPPPRGEARRDRALLDLLPVGVLIYRLDRLVYANSAFLTRIGYANLHALEDAGGLDALYVGPGVSSASSTSDTGTPVTISAPDASTGLIPSSAIDARLYTINWDNGQALALIFSGTGMESAQVAAAIAQAPAAPEPSPVGHANAEELGAILDTTADGIVMFDAEGNLNSCNRSAEALFGYDGDEFVRRNLVELFAPESQRVVMDYLESIKGAGVASLLEHGRDVLGRASRGGIIPLAMTMGRTRHDGPNFFAVFRDLSQTKKSESELQQARRLADRAANAKADLLARISHEVRTPLNAIIGFAEVMIGERFGALGNERYVEYMKDIRASGERVIAVINDLTDLSRIETGKLDLTFANQNLNDLVEQCVAVMQPQANRERIIIRSSLAHALPPVLADARALRQITLNLIGNSIHLANAGGQVIVSTALSDFGDVVLRVRDTGQGLNDNEVAAAMEPFRTQAPSDRAAEGSGVSLSLTKALVEANRAQFHLRTGAHSGTLVEVVFSQAMAKA